MSTGVNIVAELCPQKGVWKVGRRQTGEDTKVLYPLSRLGDQVYQRPDLSAARKLTSSNSRNTSRTHKIYIYMETEDFYNFNEGIYSLE